MEHLIYKPRDFATLQNKNEEQSCDDYSFTIEHFKKDFVKPPALGRMKLGGKLFRAPEQLLSLIRKSPLYALPIMLSNSNPGIAFAQEMKDTLNQVNEQLVR